ncbi:hypothetical protein EV421DRAFT_1893839 [Armillaria borealis]|uniref:DNase I-like protein n=1 Tax=Armillaria borealis TaxID=47425 RepID=A0AA39IV50_9AGAR|nr:hypothetical protein EV421DRAFT_1893839 [Armillaria borealis]
MKEQQISVLTLQETHLLEDYARDIWTLYGKHLSIHFTACVENSTAKAGVTIVLNKELVKTDEVETTELIPGRALLMQAPWHAGILFTWLTIYVPNNEDLKLLKLDGMSGDFNFVEDAIDRLPVHEDNKATVHLEKRDFSFMQMSGKFSRSRIDRIYVTDTTLDNCNQWEIRNPPIGTDHCVVSVRMTNPAAPFLGKGRWTMPLHILNNKKAIREVEETVMSIAEEIQATSDTRTSDRNPQQIYADGKEQIVRILHHYAKRSIPVKKAKMNELQAKLDVTLLDETIPEDDRLITAALLQQKVQQIQREINEG